MANIGTALTPAPVVTCLTKGGAVATGFSGTVAVAFGTNPTGATLGGTTSVAAVSGVATFSNVTVSRSGSGFTLVGSATGLRSTVSNAFSIPTQLVFTTQPASTTPNTTMANVVVTVRDTAGNTDTTYTGTVTIAKYSGTGTLSGTLSISAVAGVATFSTLSISASGTYKLIATAAEISTCYPPASVVSASFSIAEYFVTAADLSGGGSDIFGYSDGGPPGFYNAGGSVTPSTYSGATIGTFLTENVTNPPGGQTFMFVVTSVVSQSFFTSITVNGQTLTSATASFSVVSGTSQWTWTGLTGPITSAGTYPVTIA